jgi:hypothetical protein
MESSTTPKHFVVESHPCLILRLSRSTSIKLSIELHDVPSGSILICVHCRRLPLSEVFHNIGLLV